MIVSEFLWQGMLKK